MNAIENFIYALDFGRVRKDYNRFFLAAVREYTRELLGVALGLTAKEMSLIPWPHRRRH